MSTIRLIPSSYTRSNTNYVTVNNANNMYNNTDNSSGYATLQGRTRNSSTAYYAFIGGFNFSDVPSNATVSSFTIKIKAYRNSYLRTGSNFYLRLTYGSTSGTVISDTTLSSNLTTSANTYTFPTGSLTWSDLIEYADDFSIEVPLGGSSGSNAPQVYVYGAEIEVTYSLPNPRTVTSTLNGNGTISPNGITNTYEGVEYNLTITPVDKSESVTITNNGTDVTSLLVVHGSELTDSFTATDVTTSDISNGSSYSEYAVGKTAESPYSSSNNMYASNVGYAEYSFNFSSIPSNATIENIEVRCYGHRESSTIDSTHISQCVIYNGSSTFSEEVDFPSTSNSMITLTPSRMPTRTELDNLKVRHNVGYYGGLVLGITFEVTYSTGTGIDHYTYTYTVGSDATIVVTIGNAGNKIFIKLNGNWIQADKIYTKINNNWVEISKAYVKSNNVWEESDKSAIFSSNNVYLYKDVPISITELTSTTYSITGLSEGDYKFINVDGQPLISVNSEGNITKFEFKNISQSNPLHLTTGFNTLWYPYNTSKNFRVILKCYFNRAAQDDIYYPTLLSTIKESSPYPGFKILYMAGPNYSGSTHPEYAENTTLRISTTVGSNYLYMEEPSDSIYYFKMEHINGLLTITDLFTNSVILTYEGTFEHDWPLVLGMVIDNESRYGICDIYEFNIEDI